MKLSGESCSLLTLTDGTNEVFIHLVYWRVNQASQIEALLELRLAKEVERNFFARLYHSLGALLDEVGIIRVHNNVLVAVLVRVEL